MHLSDSGIHTLEHAMAQARAATSTREAGDAAALKALRGIPKEVVVRPDDLPFGTAEPGRALTAHVLLAECRVSSVHAKGFGKRFIGR